MKYRGEGNKFKVYVYIEWVGESSGMESSNIHMDTKKSTDKQQVLQSPTTTNRVLMLIGKLGLFGIPSTKIRSRRMDG